MSDHLFNDALLGELSHWGALPEDGHTDDTNRKHYLMGVAARKLRACATKITRETVRRERLEEDVDTMHHHLDAAGVPRDDGHGNVYSIWGRACLWKNGSLP